MIAKVTMCSQRTDDILETRFLVIHNCNDSQHLHVCDTRHAKVRRFISYQRVHLNSIATNMIILSRLKNKSATPGFVPFTFCNYTNTKQHNIGLIEQKMLLKISMLNNTPKMK